MAPKPEDDEIIEGSEYDEEFEEEKDGRSDEMDALMDSYLDRMDREPNSGKLLSVPVVAVRDGQVFADVGDKSEGVFPLSEWAGGDPNAPPPKAGDVVDVVVRGTDSTTGLVNLSHSEARRRAALDRLREAFEKETPVEGRIASVVKSGLMVDVGASAFMPASQIDVRRVQDLDAWVGRNIECDVVDFVPEKGRLVVSRRRTLERREKARREEIFGKMHAGDVVEGTVKRIVDFGVFVDLGGVDGLIPRSEISWNRTARPDAVVKPGETVRVKILELNSETGKITLSRKQLQTDPWSQVEKRYPLGATVEGPVVSVTDYGAFVRLEEGLDGMIHVSDMAWDAAGRRPSSFLSPGQVVQAQVLAVDAGARRISLGLKQLTDDPWADIENRFPPGSRVQGRVSGIAKYGAFVELAPGVEGMIHVSDFSWDKRVNHPKEVVAKDQEIEACVLKIDRDARRLSLGVKQLTESPIQLFCGRHRVGGKAEGEVIRVEEVGVVLRLDEGVEGFIHVSQLDVERVDNPSSRFNPGDRLEGEITKIEHDRGKVQLSRKVYLKKVERKEIAQYMENDFKGGTNLGELLSELSLGGDD